MSNNYKGMRRETEVGCLEPGAKLPPLPPRPSDLRIDVVPVPPTRAENPLGEYRYLARVTMRKSVQPDPVFTENWCPVYMLIGIRDDGETLCDRYVPSQDFLLDVLFRDARQME